MNENNNLNTGFETNPNMGMQSNMNMGVNPNMGMQPNMNTGANPNMGMQPNMNMGVNPNMGIQPNMNMGANQVNKKSNKTMIIVISIMAALIVIGVILFFVLSGGKKSLNCTQSTTESGFDMKADVIADFKDNIIDEMSMNISVDMGEYVEYKDTFIESFEEEYAELRNRGISVDITSDDTHVYIKLGANKDTYKELDMSSSGEYEEVKNYFEGEGFICK